MGKRTILKLCVKVVQVTNETKAGLGLRKARRAKKFHEINESEDNGMDDLADQVQSLFYHDVHFNNINMRMHTELGCETSQSRSKQVFQDRHGCRWKFDAYYYVHKIVPQRLALIYLPRQ